MARLAKTSHKFNVNYRLPYAEIHDAEERQLADLKTKLRARAKTTGPDGDLVGEVVHFPAADSSAQYIVSSVSPLTLAHLDICDGWHAHHATIRGMRLQDVRHSVECDRRLAKRVMR